MMTVDYSQPREGTVENLLLWARNRKNDCMYFYPLAIQVTMLLPLMLFINVVCFQMVTFQCKVMIEDIKRKSGWNYPSCGGEKCKKSVSRKAGKFLCETCNKTMDYPVFRLEVVVADDIAH
ncbi:nucleic acid-binding, OB-fold protein, partial [Tanacetum coccineum]